MIRNCVIPGDVYLGDNVYLENCIIKSRDTIRANSRYVGEDGPEIVVLVQLAVHPVDSGNQRINHEPRGNR